MKTNLHDLQLILATFEQVVYQIVHIFSTPHLFFLTVSISELRTVFIQGSLTEENKAHVESAHFIEEQLPEPVYSFRAAIIVARELFSPSDAQWSIHRSVEAARNNANIWT